MTRMSPLPPIAQQPVRARRGRAWWGVAASLAALICTTGCDTVARINFSDRTFNRVEVVGVVPTANECDGSSGQARLRFVLLDQQNVALTNADFFGSQAVAVTRDALELDQTAIFSSPDVLCAGTCEDSAFTCNNTPLLANQASTYNRCNYATGSIGATGEPAFLPQTAKPKLFAILMENTSSLSGGLPEDLAGFFPDQDGDGVGDNIQPAGPSNNRASDPRGLRRSGFLQPMASIIPGISNYATEQYKQRTYFGAWTFGRSTASITNLLNGPEITSNPSVMAAALGSFNTNNTQDVRASVYASIRAVLEDPARLGDAALDQMEKHLVVFVDGPDDLRPNAQSLNDTISAAKDRGVRVYIVHLDPSMALTDSLGYPLFRDDPEYISSQTECADDSACKGFEECRTMTSYSTSPGTNVSVPNDAQRGKNFCLPKRDESGRIGPISEYSQIACATGGNYIYVPAPGALQARAGWLPQVINGLWEVPIVVDAFAEQRVSAGQPYRVQANFSVTLNNQSQTASLSQVGGSVSNSTGADGETDSRPVLFSAP